MKDSNPNIKFNYLYRDAGNYKIFDFVIFSNPDQLSLSEIKIKLKIHLIDGEFFNPIKLDVPALHFNDFIEDTDRSWNEFESIEPTFEATTDERSINQFLKSIAKIEY